MPGADEPMGRASRLGPNRQLAWRLFLASLLAFGATVACYVLLVRTTLGERFDQAAFLGSVSHRSAVTNLSRTLLQQITSRSLLVVLLILVAIGVLRRRPLLGVAAAFAAGMAVVVTNLTRAHVFTTRPLGAPTLSFPSGHTTTAVACAMALLFVSRPAWRGIVALIAGSYGWATAAQVQLAGWHKPSDAIGAAFVAFGSVAAVAGVMAWIGPVDRDNRGAPPWAVAVLGAVAVAGAVGTGWGLVDVLGDLQNHTTTTAPPGVQHAAYLTSLALTVEVVVLLLLLLLALFGRWDFRGNGRLGGARSLRHRSQ